MLLSAFADSVDHPQPAIVFIDEFDVIIDERRIVLFLMDLMDNAKRHVSLVVATQHPHSISPELKRAGYIDHEVELSTPDAASRLEILQIHMKGVKISEQVNLETIANECHGYSGRVFKTF